MNLLNIKYVVPLRSQSLSFEGFCSSTCLQLSPSLNVGALQKTYNTKNVENDTVKPSYSTRQKTAHSNEVRTETRKCKLCEVKNFTFL